MRALHVVLLVRFACPVFAHDLITTQLTWNRDVSRVFRRRCISCHGANAAIPFTAYEQARPWATAIKEQVLRRSMPPWGAVKGFGDFDRDPALTQEEVSLIAAWAAGGAPEGDPSDAIPEPANPSASVAERAHRELPIAVRFDTRGRLSRGMLLSGVRPLAVAPVRSAKIIAILPSGETIPLVWLYEYDPKWQKTFRFREPLQLAAGTEIVSSAALRFALTGPPRKR